jgi:hypothetical protein
MKFSKIILMIALVFTFSCGTGVDDIINKNLIARGGADKWHSFKTLEFAMVIQTQGIEMPIVISQKDNDKINMQMGSGSISSLTTIFNGKEGWRVMMQKIDTITPKDFAEAKFQLLTQYLLVEPVLLNWKDNGYSLTQDGIEKVGKDEWFKMQVKDKSNNKFTLYIDKASGLEKRVDTEIESNKTKKTLSFFLEDYKTLESVQIPHTLVIKMDGSEIGKIVLKDTKINKSLDDILFKMPVIDTSYKNNPAHMMHGMSK